MKSRKVTDKWERHIVVYLDGGFAIAMHEGTQVCAGTEEQVNLWLTRTGNPKGDLF